MKKLFITINGTPFKQMKKIQLLIIQLLIFLLCRLILFSKDLPKQISTGTPNIVIILSDDLGWGDVSCYQPGNTYKTPNIDRLAEEGVLFTNAHTPHAVCTPTRYSLLTGRYCWRTWCREAVLPGYAKPLIAPGRMTLASLLKQKGYTTGAFGKWHIGMEWTTLSKDDPGDFPFGSQITQGSQALADISTRVDHSVPVKGGPVDVGFDSFFGTPSNCARIPVFIRNDRVIGSLVRDKSGMIRNPELKRNSVDDIYVDEAIKFMESATKSEKPFFIYLALNAIHGAVLVPDEFIGKSGVSLRTDKCLWVDKNVGRINDALDQNGLTENTIVIFTSDNGPFANHGIDLEKGHDASGPFKGFKTDAWEGGTRVPFIVRWPGHIQPGTNNNSLLCLTDMIATFAALTNQELPEWAGEDSFNQLPVILGKSDAPQRETMITESFTGVLSIYRGPWKLIVDTKGSGGYPNYSFGAQPIALMSPWRTDLSIVGQLYNLDKDPYETTDLYEIYPNIVKELELLLREMIKNGRSFNY